MYCENYIFCPLNWNIVFIIHFYMDLSLLLSPSFIYQLAQQLFSQSINFVPIWYSPPLILVSLQQWWFWCDRLATSKLLQPHSAFFCCLVGFDLKARKVIQEAQRGCLKSWTIKAPRGNSQSNGMGVSRYISSYRIRGKSWGASFLDPQRIPHRNEHHVPTTVQINYACFLVLPLFPSHSPQSLP